jgi:hypothetical protein
MVTDLSKKVMLVYSDEGPKGICGQSMNITCPWTDVYVFDSEDELYAWTRGKTFGTGRRKPRITVCGGEGNCNRVIYPVDGTVHIR